MNMQPLHRELEQVGARHRRLLLLRAGAVAWGALAVAGRELLDQGSYQFWESAGRGQEVTSAAFS